MSPEEYKQLMESRAKLSAEISSGGIVDESAPMQDGVGQEAVMAARSPQPQVSKTQQAGQLMTAVPNPYVAGAGVALQGIGMVDNAKRQQEQAKIDAYNRKVAARMAAATNNFA